MKEIIKPGYKKTPVGIIPEDWEVVRLGEICSHFRSGKGITSKNILEVGKYPVYGGNGLRGYTESYTHKGKYILIGRQGALCGNIQVVQGEQYISEHAIAVQTNENNHLEFLGKKLDYYNLNRLSESSAQPGLAVNKLVRLRLPIPPLPEQKAIADCLSTWDRGIDKLTALIDAKKEQKKGLMQKLLTGSLRLHSATGEPFNEEWKEVRLGEIGKTINGLTGKNKKDFGEGSPFVTYLNVYNNNKITNKTEFDLVKINKNEKQTCLKFGDIIFTTSSETPHEVGMSSVILFHPKTELYLNSFCFGLRLHNLKTINAQFSSFLFRSKGFRKIMYKLAQGSTRFNLSKSSFNDITLNIPSLEEQTAIAQVLTTADREIELLEQKLAAMKEQKKGLMQVLLTGEKRLV